MDPLQITHWSKLGAAVKDLRVERGLSQQELATRARVSRSWLARVESGHRGAELEPLLRLFTTLGTRLSLTVVHSEPGVPEESSYALSAGAQARELAWNVEKSHVN